MNLRVLSSSLPGPVSKSLCAKTILLHKKSILCSVSHISAWLTFLFTDFSFVVYEKINTEILVYEICGHEEEIVNLLFNNHGDCKKIILRVPSDEIKTDFGMTLTLNELETELKSIYFGMPYA